MLLEKRQSGWEIIMNRLVVCVISHDYVDSLKNVLSNNVPIFEKYSMDVIVLNSSENVDETVRFINDLKLPYKINIKHIHVPQAVRLEEKMQILFEGAIFEGKKYDYVWPIGQRRIVSDELCKEVRNQIEKYSDFITIFNQGEKNRVIRDKNEYFHACGEQSIMLGAAIYRNSLIKGLDLNALFKKYETADPTTFYQMSIYFEAISCVKNFYGVILCIEDAITISRIKTVKYWEKARFLTWGRTFPSFVLQLPSIYENQNEFVEHIQSKKFSLSLQTAYDCVKNGSLTKSTFSDFDHYFKKYTKHYYLIKCMLEIHRLYEILKK